jgi:hypothetical protein
MPSSPEIINQPIFSFMNGKRHPTYVGERMTMRNI